MLRDAWYRKIADWRADQVVFLDESGLNKKMGERSYGYGPKGRVIRSKVTAQKAENISLLPAMTIDGYIACNIYHGSVNRVLFEEFIENDVLPLCGRYPGPRSIIVMDNASIHRSEVPYSLLKVLQMLMLASISKKSSKTTDASSNSFLHTPQISIL